MNTRANIRPALLVGALLLAAGACGGDEATGPQPRPGSLTILPEQVEVPPSSTYFLVVRAKDASGHDVPLSDIIWTSDAPDVAVADSEGRIISGSPGSAVITATAAGATDTVFVTVSTSPGTGGGDWPHEPSGLTPISDQSWSSLDLVNWLLQFGTAIIAQDPTAPLSPPGVLKIIYPIGFVGGAAPGTEMLTMPGKTTVFVGTWWKGSDPWQGHPSNSNKIQYLFAEGGGSMAMIMYGTPGGPYELRVFPDWHGAWLTPNVANVPVTLGVWHRIEWLVQYGPPGTSGTGIVRWWLDGQLLGDYSNVQLSPTPLTAYKVAPVWGGAELVLKTELDYFEYDHTYVSGQ